MEMAGRVKDTFYITKGIVYNRINPKDLYTKSTNSS